jgi:hypothetical protein
LNLLIAEDRSLMTFWAANGNSAGAWPSAGLPNPTTGGLALQPATPAIELAVAFRPGLSAESRRRANTSSRLFGVRAPWSALPHVEVSEVVGTDRRQAPMCSNPSSGDPDRDMPLARQPPRGRDAHGAGAIADCDVVTSPSAARGRA